MAKVAKYQKGRLRRVDAAGAESWVDTLPMDIADLPSKGDLICFGCPVPLRLTRSYTRGSGTEVPVYLSLYSGSEHAADCELKIETLHAKLLETSPDSVSVEGKTLYLHLPDEERVANHQSGQRRTGGGGERNTWAATMNSAAAIARFLRSSGDATDYLNELKIRYRDHRGEISEIFWSDFCFEARSVEALKHYRRVEAEGASVPPAAVIFPVARRQERPAHRFMRVDTFQRPDPDDSTLCLYLSVAESLDPDQQLLTGIDSRTILVLGRATSFPWQTDQYNVTEMRFLVEDRWQMVAFEP